MGFAGVDEPETKTLIPYPSYMYFTTTTWEDGDQVGLYIADANTGLKSSSNYADNVKLTYNGSEWIPEREIWFPTDGSNVSFYAYYPYDPAMTDPLNYMFSVSSDQNKNYVEVFRKNDFLWAKSENVSESSTPISLRFSHAMAMVYLRLTVYLNYIIDIIPAKLSNVQTQCRLNLRDQNIISSGTLENISICQWGGYNTIGVGGITSLVRYYSALLPPQTINTPRYSWEYEGKTLSADYPQRVITSGKSTEFKATSN